MDAVTSRAQSVNSAESIANHVEGYVYFYLDARSGSAVALTGEEYVALNRDSPESL